MADSSKTLTYRDYVEDREHMAGYSRYQKKYAGTARESDKVLIGIIQELARELVDGGERPALLDLGCSTGNLLLHLKNALPRFELSGGDIVGPIVEECRGNPNLAGIRFAEMDMLALGRESQYDFVVTNAALMFFDEEEFVRAVRNIAAAVKPGGWFLAFDLFHPFEQEVAVTERSKGHPRGLKFHFRSYGCVRDALEQGGLGRSEFRPFDMPIDLPRPADPSDVTSYTLQTTDGFRMSFRGTLMQPWCHLTATR